MRILKGEIIMKVTITRQPIKYIKSADIDIKHISDIHWGYTSGGVQVTTVDPYLYGYIQYKMAMDLVDCSGTHEEENCDAKVCILQGLNKRNKNIEGYEYCRKQAGTKPPSWISQNRPSGYPPCTKQIINELKKLRGKPTTEVIIERQEIRDIILAIGYPSSTFRSAMKTLEGQKKIKTEGDPRSPKQKVILL